MAKKKSAETSAEYEFYGAVENGVLLRHRTACGGSHNIAIPDNVTKLGFECFEGEWCESVIIPSSVKLVGEEAFNHCENLREVILNEGIEELGAWAFNACCSLESVHIPASVVKIDKKKQPFNNCYGLREITVDENNPVYYAENNCLIERKTGTVITGCSTSVIPDNGSIKAIGEGAFCRQFRLKKIKIPHGVERIERLAFYFCGSLAEVELPETVTTLGSGAFERCDKLAKINIDHITSFADCVFSDCKKLPGELVLSDDVKKLGARAFAYSSVESVTIGRGITFIDDGVFRNCESLKKVVLPEGLTKIEKNAFICCEKLESINLPSTVKYIGRGAFFACEKLKNIVLPPDVEFVAKDAFEECAEKVRVSRKTSNPDFEIDGTDLCKYRGKTAAVVIPDGLTKIKAKAFRNKKTLKSVVIPASVTNIAASAFEGCENLGSITVAEGNPKYRSINNCIVDFKNKTLVCGCNASVLPESGINKIGPSAFYKCKTLESAIIPPGVKKIGNKAFEGCTALKTVTFPDGLEEVGSYAFNECSSLQAAKFGPGLKLIDILAFCECRELAELVLPEGLEKILAYAFENCNKLEVLDLPEGLTVLDYPFKGCNSLRRISFPSTVTNMYNSGLTSNPNLVEITVAEGNPKYHSKGNCLIFSKSYVDENNVTKSYVEIHLGCTTSVIPQDDGITLIRDNAFSNCDIETVVIPEGVVSLYSDSFRNCKKLKNLTIPSTLKNLSTQFSDCENLENVYAPKRYRDCFKNHKIKFTATD